MESCNDGPFFKLGDFGLARRAGKLTGCQTFCGTLEYMAPEVCATKNNDASYGQQADVWSFGICLYMVATAESPYYNDELFKQVVLGAIVWSSAIPGYLHSVIANILIPEAMERATAHDIATLDMKCG